MGGITNTAIYQFLEGQVLARLTEMNQHLIRLNGKVQNLEKQAESHTGQLVDHDGKIVDVATRLAVVEAVGSEREKRQEGEMGEARQERREMRRKLWEIGKQVVEIGVLVTALTKILEVW